jgi:hypothetical protein
MATAGGVVAKLMHRSIQRMCWLDGIGRGRAPHSAMSPPDPSRHFDGAALTSDLARLADILRVIRQVSKVPKPEVVVV